MKNLFLLIVLLALAGGGYYYYADGERSLRDIPADFANFLRDMGADRLLGTQLDPGEKCTTAEGEVIYGEVPEGVRCEKVEKVEGSMTVVPRDVITSVNAPVRDESPAGQSAATGTAQSTGDNIISCENITYCAQFESCEQVRIFAHNCQTWHVYDADRITCMKRWCEDLN